MKIFVFVSFIVCLVTIISPVEIFADTALDVKEIENSLKEGSRKKVCSRQREAARLGLLANKSLIKAFEIEGANPPMQAIKASQQRWESILNEC